MIGKLVVLRFSRIQISMQWALSQISLSIDYWIFSILLFVSCAYTSKKKSLARIHIITVYINIKEILFLCRWLNYTFGLYHCLWLNGLMLPVHESCHGNDTGSRKSSWKCFWFAKVVLKMLLVRESCPGNAAENNTGKANQWHETNNALCIMSWLIKLAICYLWLMH